MITSPQQMQLPGSGKLSGNALATRAIATAECRRSGRGSCFSELFTRVDSAMADAGIEIWHPPGTWIWDTMSPRPDSIATVFNELKN